MFRTLLASENQSFGETMAGSQVVRIREALEEFNECARDGCGNEGTKRCNRCKVVRHCCKDCQVKDWKVGHRKACRKAASSGSASASAQVIQSVRTMATVALRIQYDFLHLNPQVDYRIVLPSGK